jgi:hypothetical protein
MKSKFVWGSERACGALGFEEVHGGHGFENRNLEGELLLEFAETMKLIVTNMWFQKGDRQKVTYESDGD